MYYSELSPNQLRVYTDTRQTYEAYSEAKKRLAHYSGGMYWKKVSGHEYLVKVINRTGGNKSLGPRSTGTEALYAEFCSGKERAGEMERHLSKSVHEFAGMSKGVGINRVPPIVTAALRKLNEYGLLGKTLMVIGTNAMYGYESAAGVMFDAGLMATTDMDLLWDARTSLKLAAFDGEVAEAGVLAILKKVDSSFIAVSETGFRAVNKTGFHVDLVKQAPDPPWRKEEPERIASGDLQPALLSKIKWLLSSEKFRAIIIGQDGLPSPIISPDPRAFAVYKHWLSSQPDREPQKKRRDLLQANALADLVTNKFPHLPFDENAERMFPKNVRQAGFAL